MTPAAAGGCIMLRQLEEVHMRIAHKVNVTLIAIALMLLLLLIPRHGRGLSAPDPTDARGSISLVY